MQASKSSLDTKKECFLMLQLTLYRNVSGLLKCEMKFCNFPCPDILFKMSEMVKLYFGIKKTG